MSIVCTLSGKLISGFWHNNLQGYITEKVIRGDKVLLTLAIFKVTYTLWPKQLVCTLLNRWIQTKHMVWCITGMGKNLIRFWWPWPYFQGHHMNIFWLPWSEFQGHHATWVVKMSIVCTLEIWKTNWWILTKFAWIYQRGDYVFVILTLHSRSQGPLVSKSAQKCLSALCLLHQ